MRRNRNTEIFILSSAGLRIEKHQSEICLHAVFKGLLYY